MARALLPQLCLGIPPQPLRLQGPQHLLILRTGLQTWLQAAQDLQQQPCLRLATLWQRSGIRLLRHLLMQLRLLGMQLQPLEMSCR